MLAKRTVGSPLSEAERRQRQDAARARWGAAKIGAAAVGATAGLSIAQAAIQHRHALGMMQILSAHDAALGPEERRHAAKDAQIVVNQLRTKSRITSRWPVPAMRAALYQDKRDATKELRAGEEAVAPYEDHRRLVLEALADQQAAHGEEAYRIRRHLADHPSESIANLYRPTHAIAGAQSRINELADAQQARSVDRAGRTYRLTPHTRRIKLREEIKPQFASKLDAAREAAEEAGEHFVPPKHWFRPVYQHIEVKPKPGASKTEAHRVRVAGTPDPKGIRSIRTELSGRIDAHASVHRAAEEARHAASLGAIRTSLSSRAAEFSRYLPSRRFKLLALGAGALGGALAGYGAATGAHQLAKAAGDDTVVPANARDGTDDLPNAAQNAEESLAQMLARMFGDWKDRATTDLRTPREKSLYSTILTDLDRATEPLGPALQAGANAPVEAALPDDDGGAHVIHLSMGARGPEMERYIADYRQDRILQLADDQRETIRNVLLHAAQNGDSPDEMASQIRQTIGLTTNQAAMVLNYRRELETLNPAALKRGLRDKRFDKTIERAIHDAGTLTPKQISAAVDAYHRRFLAYRAMTIARTEGVGAANNAHIAAVRSFLEANPDYTVIKGWNAKVDDRTRPDHKSLHGTSVVGIDTPFVCDSGEEIRWPHDPLAAAKEIVNCRCFPSLRIVHRSLAGSMGMGAVRPFSEELAGARKN